MVKITKEQIRAADVDHDGLEANEWKKFVESVPEGDRRSVEVEGMQGMQDLTKLTYQDVNKAIPESGESKSPAADSDQKVSEHTQKLEGLMKQLQEAKTEDEKNRIKAQMAEVLKQAHAANQSASKPASLTKFYQAAGIPEPEGGQQLMSGKAQIGMGGAAQGTGSTTPYSAQIPAAGSGTPGFSAPSGWSAQTLGGGMPTFSSDAYMKTMAMEGDIQSSWDSINKNTNRGKQLMMLFFYFARMAESGDMTAMYQFMKFITYVISKDKAKQQIEMGKKLIQLQELSRQWTNKLLNVQTNSNDAAASNELMKTMTIVKSETDAIATSQKLISQMMEEFAQVVETLTNTTKAALETAGRISRTVSTMR